MGTEEAKCPCESHLGLMSSDNKRQMGGCICFRVQGQQRSSSGQEITFTDRNLPCRQTLLSVTAQHLLSRLLLECSLKDEGRGPKSWMNTRRPPMSHTQTCFIWLAERKLTLWLALLPAAGSHVAGADLTTSSLICCVTLSSPEPGGRAAVCSDSPPVECSVHLPSPRTQPTQGENQSKNLVFWRDIAQCVKHVPCKH